MFERQGTRWLARLAATGHSPRRTAAAFALGVFLSFSPFLGLQMLTGLLLAFALRLSRAAMFVGLCTNLPWIMVPWYTLTTVAGAMLLRLPVTADFRERLNAVLSLPFYRMVFWERAFELVSPFAWAFLVGSTIGAIAVGALAYVATVPLIGSLQTRHGERG